MTLINWTVKIKSPFEYNDEYNQDLVNDIQAQQHRINAILNETVRAITKNQHIFVEIRT